METEPTEWNAGLLLLPLQMEEGIKTESLYVLAVVCM